MPPKKQPHVLVLMGSESDLPVMKEALQEVARGAAERGLRVLIAGAGMANHLAGALAAHTILPVIAVPLAVAPLYGFDALLSSVQMPPGVPVATVAVGAAGARNAALLAVQMLALSDEVLRRKLLDYKEEMVRAVEKRNRAAQQELEKSE
jgi:phosphoribosylaminoimidazole carboxylase PurE protein